MKIAITDTNVFISLIRVELLDRLFLIGYEIHTTQHVLGELTDWQRTLADKYVEIGSLIVHHFTAQEVLEIANLEISKGLSYVDKGLFYYNSKNEKYLLLTSDKLLKKISKKGGIDVHGILWLMDSFLALNVATKAELLIGLTVLTQHYHRLPKEECEKRVLLWNE